jgi:hypothetical protein
MSILEKAKWFLPLGFAYKSEQLWASKPLGDDARHSFSRGTTSNRRTDCGQLISIDTAIPRIDYVDGSPRMAVDMEQTNYVPYSTVGSGWDVQSNVTRTANVYPSPEGKINATRLVYNGSGSNQIYQYLTSSFTSGKTWCFSGWFKHVSGANTIRFALYQGNWSGVDITQTSESSVSLSVLQGGGTPIHYGSQYYGDGWHRVWFTLAANSTTKEFNINREGLSATSSEWAVWGMQAGGSTYNDDGATLMSYIPTTSSIVTKNRDFHSYGYFNTPYAFAAREDFSFYWHGTFAYPGAQSGSTTKRDSMLAGGGYYQDGLEYRSYIWMMPDGRLRITGTGEALMADSSVGILTADGTEYKIAITRSGGSNIRAFINGSEVTMTPSSPTIAFTFRSLGWAYSTYYHTRGSIYEAAIFDQSLTTAEMQSLTTL